ncbi:MAG: 4-hydroxy-3-methylbut-2-enyl diphosphate reductase [Candidatus Firestonebacteria bacterium]
MKVILSKHAGFCFGVKRAIKTAIEAKKAANGRVYTYGPLIHNPQVVSKFERDGIVAVESVSNIKSGSTIIIRTHGVSPAIEEIFRKKKLKIIDATCPFVKKPQKNIAKLVAAGYKTVIIGEADHPEVQGIKGYSVEKAGIVGTPEEAKKLVPSGKLGIVVQTTQSMKNFQQIMEILLKKAQEVKIYNTICSATHERQDSALKLAGEVDIMIVVGGHNSANTKHLAEVCETTGVVTRQIEDASELQNAWFKGKKKAGVTAGASTPEWVIKEVVSKLKKL